MSFFSFHFFSFFMAFNLKCHDYGLGLRFRNNTLKLLVCITFTIISFISFTDNTPSKATAKGFLATAGGIVLLVIVIVAILAIVATVVLKKFVIQKSKIVPIEEVPTPHDIAA